MRVSLNWLREFLASEAERLSAATAAEMLTMAGLTVEAVTAAEEDTLLDLDLTTNRPDALGHYGVARELAAAAGLGLRPLAESQPTLAEGGPEAGEAMRVTIEAAEDCARYCGRVLDGLVPGPAPAAISRRLEALGQRAINNAADLTNYTLLELGHPTHAFDADTLEGGEIRVRRARAGETLVTLDGVERRLAVEDLVIADARRPVALAGVMGGLETAIGPKTRRVMIESAWFRPALIRRSAQRHGLHTDASHRFERGADPEICALAADRVTARLQAAAGGVILRGRLDQYPQPWQASRMPLRAEALRRLLGADIRLDAVQRILTALGIATEVSGAGAEARWSLTATAPSWRPDLREEVDLVEEVARIYGYDRFPARLPGFAGVARPSPAAAAEARLRARLRALGYAEAVALSFAAEGECRELGGAGGLEPVAIQHPISEEAAVMRSTALPSMVHLLQYNLNRGQEQPRLFEIGKIYGRAVRSAAATADTREPEPWVQERRVVTLGATGGPQSAGWTNGKETFDFFALKTAIDAVLEIFGPLPLTLAPLEDPAFHPGRSAGLSWHGRPIARFGQFHPDRAGAWKLKADVYLAEIELEPLLACGPRQQRFTPPPRYPASERDFSFLFPNAVSWAQVEAAIAALQLEALASVTPLEVFHGGQLPEERYSLLLRARFQLAERTLREEEVTEQAARIVAALARLGGRQR
ncbi:MAG: phenylalanine--tRNA ligase subunit beta [Terriglobales bacterium]